LLWWFLAQPSRWVALLFCSALLLPPLPIALGDSGPHPALVAAALGIFAGLLQFGAWRLRVDLVTGLLVTFFMILLASVAAAVVYSGPMIAAASLARVLLFGISIYVYLWTVSQTGPLPGPRMLFWIALAAAAFACADFFFQLPAPSGYGAQFVWLQSGVYRRAQGLFYEASTLGNFCAFFLVMTAVGLLHPKEATGVPRWVLAAGGAVFGATLIFSYSRASVVNVVIALGCLVIVNRRRFRIKRTALPVTAALACATAASYAIFPAFARLYWERLLGSFVNLFESTEGILSGRVQAWTQIAGALAEHPWHLLFGVGYKTLPYSDVLGAPVVADNMYLALLAETGIAGLVAVLVLHAAILQASWRARASFYGMWILCFWAGQTVQMLSGDLLTYWRVLPLYFYVLARAVR
ncbi:MAG: O-antigen ligase family protein, partial [Bryobacteraceae bacterium]